MGILGRTLATVVLALACFGCGTHYVNSSGSHAANYSFLGKSRKYIVWSRHSPGREHETAVNAAITQYLQVSHQTVVERSQLEAVFREQRVRLLHTAEADADLLRAGEILGADQIIFAESTSSYQRGGYLASIRVRAVDVQSAAVLWSGSALVTEPIRNVDESLAGMAQIAIYRALCPIEQGFRWIEYSSNGEGGCSKE